MSYEYKGISRSAAMSRTAAFPLDEITYFESFEKAQAAAKTAVDAGSAESTHYVGEILTVVNQKLSSVELYKIQNKDGLLIKITDDGEYTELCGNVSILSTITTQHTIDIKNILKDIKGGVNYKGHIKTYNKLGKNPSTDNKPFDLKYLFGRYYDPDVTGKILTADPDTGEYTFVSSFALNNGLMYCVNLSDEWPLSSGKYCTRDGIELTDRDYIIIHDHELSCVELSDITSANIDIIETQDSDYVRFPLLSAISTELSIDYVNKILTLSDSVSATVQLSVKNLQIDIDSLSNQVSAISSSLCSEVSSLSSQVSAISSSLCSEISSLSDQISAISSNLCSEVSSLSTLVSSISSNICAEVSSLSSQVSAISSSLCSEVSSLSSQVSSISSNLCAEAISLSSQVSSISSNLCTEISSLSSQVSSISGNLCAEISSLSNQVSSISSNLCSELSVAQIDIENLKTYVSGDYSLCSNLSVLSSRYDRTFDEMTYTTGGPDVKMDVLKIRDAENLETEFRLEYLSGTLVLTKK